MTGLEALSLGRRCLAEVSDEASLEAELLLLHALELNRVQLYQRLHDRVGIEEEAAYRAMLRRRLRCEPTPYIIGRKEFYGLSLLVSPAAIIPRPETENVVDVALAEGERILARQTSIKVVDVGVGCGAIALAIAVNEPRSDVVGIDISPAAVALAWKNSDSIEVQGKISFMWGDSLNELREPADVIVANLPYVKTSDWEQLPLEIRDHEPRSGLDGGEDGLRVIESFLAETPRYLREDGALVLEIGCDQSVAVGRMASFVFPGGHVEVRQDLAGLDRVVLVRHQGRSYFGDSEPSQAV